MYTYIEHDGFGHSRSLFPLESYEIYLRLDEVRLNVNL